ncbi:MAG: type II toxin-antitoxin system RelB/DinJ family antitoxin, partial [Rhodocyclaceae bacterium]|nr:type II toxin-antitoxin system RelB/DinJ family antitoxin [Rhodocyclaceae bacterium]
MSTNNFNMSFDAATRQAFADVLADYGLTVPQAFKLFANQVIKTGVVPLSFDWREKQPQRAPSEKL